MQKEVIELKGKDVETLYLSPTDSGSRDTPVNSGQHRLNSKPNDDSRVKTITPFSSSVFPTTTQLEDDKRRRSRRGEGGESKDLHGSLREREKQRKNSKNFETDQTETKTSR